MKIYLLKDKEGKVHHFNYATDEDGIKILARSLAGAKCLDLKNEYEEGGMEVNMNDNFVYFRYFENNKVFRSHYEFISIENV